jgi:peptide-methionine (S)-S-oxide reductase
MLAPVLLLTAMAVVPAPHAPPRPRATATVILAGGCFWGVESVFRHVRGVVAAVSGYAVPGTIEWGPRETDHVEAVRITYDPARLSYREILAIFFSVAHDPTEGDRQGPDVGAEYRSVLFVAGARESRMARAWVDSLAAARVYPRSITTAIATVGSFIPAEAFHQDYAARHPDDPYIVANDVPKVAALRREFPTLFRDRPAAVTPRAGRGARR